MKTLSELAALLGLELAHGGGGVLRGVAGIPAAGQEELVFAEDEQALAMAQASNAGAVLTTAALAAQVKGTKPVLTAKQPRLEFARAARALRGEDQPRGVHKSAVVAASAKVGEDVSIGP